MAPHHPRPSPARHPDPPLPAVHGRYSRGLFKHAHSLATFRGLPFEDVAVIGPRGGSQGKDWRRAAVFKEGWVARRRGCKQSKELKERKVSAFLGSGLGGEGDQQTQGGGWLWLY